LIELLHEVGGRVPAERALPSSSVPARDGAAARGPMRVRQGLGHALTVAVQSTEGWRALDRIATRAQQDRVSEAIMRASASVGREPEEQVAFLCETLLDQTVEMVLA
jgi:hypothetical protein